MSFSVVLSASRLVGLTVVAVLVRAGVPPAGADVLPSDWIRGVLLLDPVSAIVKKTKNKDSVLAKKHKTVLAVVTV